MCSLPYVLPVQERCRYITEARQARIDNGHDFASLGTAGLGTADRATDHLTEQHQGLRRTGNDDCARLWRIESLSSGRRS